MRPPVYLDYAATTPVRPEVLEAMLPYLTAQSFGNPSSAHRFGRAARAGIEQARRQVAEAVGAIEAQALARKVEKLEGQLAELLEAVGR